MKIAVVGGGLQGIETTYLARKAGWHVTLVDRRSAPPARGLSHEFIQLDISVDGSARTIFEQMDLVLPALEDQDAIGALAYQAQQEAAPLAFDSAAYAVTSSKTASNDLFSRLNMPLPAQGELTDGPVIVKPSTGSGSSGVKLFSSHRLARPFLDNLPDSEPWVCQKFLPGPTFSIEVLGKPGHYRTRSVTDLSMDEVFDCKRVQAPSTLAPKHQRALAEMAQHLAEALSLNGIMDVEAVLNKDRLYLLEIDARIPSQTPTAVYWTSGVNMVAELAGLFVQKLPGDSENIKTCDAVVYEHIQISGGTIRTCGEHVLSQAGPLALATDFFGCQEAITDYKPGCHTWVATLICMGSDRDNAWRKRCATIDRICVDQQLVSADNPTGDGA